MPYIPQNMRGSAKEIECCSSLAELCYHIVNDILRFWGFPNSKERIKWQNYAEILGMLESIKLELYRKVISKYEDKKEKENGTVWK